MEKNVSIGIIIAAILVVLVAGVGSVYYLTAGSDFDLEGAAVIEDPEQKALQDALASLQADQKKLLADLEAAKNQLLP
jgi:hypothetical protein